MSTAQELADLFRRDLTRLMQELESFPDAALWTCPDGITNSAGNLTLHLEGNLREFVGRQLGAVPYTRERNLEFSSKGLRAADLATRIEAVRDLVHTTITGLTIVQLEAVFPENVLGRPISTQQFLLSLYGHLSYHLGQIDYLRRILTSGPPIKFAGL